MPSGIIVFVHGLGGHPRKTWGAFADLIRDDPAFERFEIGYYSFPTSLFRFPWSRRYPRVQRLADGLRTLLENRFTGRDDVILVCHSLGGLIARRYLVDEVKRGRPLRVQKLLLYAVPNDGSGLGNVGQHVSWSHSQLAQLARRSEFLDDLNEDWAVLGLSDKLQVKYVVALQDNVVDDASARAFPGNPDVETVTDRGHRSLVKPEAEEDLAYHIFRNFMEAPRIPPSSDAGTRVTVTRFRSAGGESEHQILANGVTDRLIKNLTSLEGVDPVPRVAMTRRRDKTPIEIAEEFNADYVVEGSVEKLPGSDRWTIFAHLSEIGADGPRAVWSDTYERRWSDVQEVLVEVTKKMARRIKHTVTQTDLRRLESAPIPPVNAWKAFMDGSWMVEVFNNGHLRSDFRKAEASLKKALELDEGYAEALEQLGFLYIVAWEVLGNDRLLSRSRDAWKRLLTLDEDDAVALAELGFLAYVRKDESEAVELARRAVRADPENTIAQNVLALIYLYLGYYESQSRITRREVVERDPYYVYPYTNMALSYQLRGEFAKGLQWAREARREDRRAMVGILLEGAQHFHRGSLDEAARIWREGMEICEDGSDRAILDTAVAWTLARADDVDGARSRIGRYRKEAWVGGGYGPYFISLCSLAGEKDLALELLETPETYARSYRYLVSDETLEPLASASRFADLLEERHEEWCRNLEEFRDGLPVPPNDVPEPQEYLDRVRRGRSGDPVRT